MFATILLSAVDAKKGSGGTSGTSAGDGQGAATTAAAATIVHKHLLSKPYGDKPYNQLTTTEKAYYFYFYHKAEMIVLIAVLAMFFFVKCLMKRMKDRDENFRKAWDIFNKNYSGTLKIICVFQF